MIVVKEYEYTDTERTQDLRRRVREAMEQPPVAVHKARAIALKLSQMPTDLWEGQLFAGSMTLEHPRVHAERGFPDYTTEADREEAKRHGVSPHGCFGGNRTVAAIRCNKR